MKSLQHVLWRGALALSLMAIGIGSGLGLPAAEQATSPDDCTSEARALIADETDRSPARGEPAAVRVVVRHQLTPAG